MADANNHSLSGDTREGGCLVPSSWCGIALQPSCCDQIPCTWFWTVTPRTKNPDRCVMTLTAFDVAGIWLRDLTGTWWWLIMFPLASSVVNTSSFTALSRGRVTLNDANTSVGEVWRWSYQVSYDSRYGLCGLVVRVPGYRTECIVLPVRYELNLYMLCRRK
jgi:hypothetical protein